MIKIHEFSVTTPDNIKLYSWIQEPPTPSTNPTLVWIHGFAEHSKRYSSITDFFANRHYTSICFDLRGHGRSEGKRGFISHFNQYLLDLYSVLHFYKDRLTNGIILLGHSMGGLIVIRFAQSLRKIDKTDPQWELIANFQKRYRFQIRHFIVTSPLLGFAIPIPKWKIAVAQLLGPLFPTLSLPTNLNPEHLSHDLNIVEEYKNDPLILKNATVGWFLATKQAIQLAHKSAIDTPGPISIFAAGEDYIVSLESTKQFYSCLPNNIQKSLHVFHNWYHEILNEPNKIEAYEKILQTIQHS